MLIVLVYEDNKDHEKNIENATQYIKNELTNSGKYTIKLYGK